MPGVWFCCQHFIRLGQHCASEVRSFISLGWRQKFDEAPQEELRGKAFGVQLSASARLHILSRPNASPCKSPWDAPFS